MKVIKKNYTLEQRHIDKIKMYAKLRSVSESAALRMIIDDDSFLKKAGYEN